MGLPAADQFEIDLRQKLGVEQRSVQGAVGVVDAEALAESIQRRRGSGKFPARHLHGIDGPGHRHGRKAQSLELGIEKLQVELGVVDDQPRVGEELQQLGHDLGKDRLVGEESRGEAVDSLRLGRHLAIRLQIALELAARRQMVDQLDGRDLDQPVTGIGIEAGGFSIENDLAHGESLCPASP